MSYEPEKQAALLLRQGAAAADRMGRAVPGRFVTGPEQDFARRMANEYHVQAAFSGGHEEPDREQVCFCLPGDEPVFTLVWVEVTWDARFTALRHSDLFGSLMSLGIDRSYFGDLIAADDRAWLAVLPEIASRLPDEWTEAGHTRIRCRCCTEAPEIPRPQGSLVRDTVASLRLDAILSAALNQARTHAAELIRAGKVEVDHAEELRTDRVLTAGRLISVRGFGRIRLREVGEPNRKGRIPVLMECFTRHH